MVLPKMVKHLWSYHLLGPSHSCVNTGLLLSATLRYVGIDAEFMSGHCQWQQSLHHLPVTVGCRSRQPGPSAPCHPLCFSPARNIHFQSLKHSMANSNFAHVAKSLVLVHMALIALPVLQEWMEEAGLTLGEGSEVALGLHWRYFASDTPSCCCT